jgi:plastocyanin
MKAATIFLIAIMAVQSLKAQTIHTVKESGFTFDPATLTINAGESVKFEGTASHPIQEVSKTTWDNNGITPLENGFAFSTGSGTVNFPLPGTYYYVCTAHVASQGMKGKIIVLAPSAVEENPSSDNYSIYPVPLTGNELTVTLKDPVQKSVSFEIYDLAGNLKLSAHNESVSNQYLIDCSSLPKGMFLMKLKADGEEFFSKVLRL